MTDVPATSRRRDRGRAQRSTGPSLAPLPRLTNRWTPLEILTAEQVERILVAAFEVRSEEHTSELQSQSNLVCRLLLEKKKQTNTDNLSDHMQPSVTFHDT